MNYAVIKVAYTKRVDFLETKSCSRVCKFTDKIEIRIFVFTIRDAFGKKPGQSKHKTTLVMLPLQVSVYPAL